MVFPVNFWILFGICMLVSSIGFKNYVWFISLGYGFSIAAQGVAMLIMYGQGLTLGTIITSVLFILYGLRLGGYLAIREFGGSAYKKNMKGEIKDGKTVPFGVKIAIWTSWRCAVCDPGFRCVLPPGQCRCRQRLCIHRCCGDAAGRQLGNRC